MVKDRAFLESMGNRIRNLRKNVGWTQETLAAKINVTPQMISSAESGLKAIRPENLKNMAKVFGVSADYLLTGDVGDKDLRRLRDKIAKLNVQQLDHLEKIVDHCIALGMGE